MSSTRAALYAPPSGGWFYLYDGDPLDAAWDHDNGSDQWDGTAIGAGRPGGLSALTAGLDDFLRIQDTGDPRDHGMGDPGSNRKVYLTRDLAGMPATFLDTGVTLSFRARLPNAPPLDDVHPDGGGAIVPWPAGGDGYQIHDGGKSAIGLRQGSGDKIISFGLAKASDHAAFGSDGLTFNSLAGTSPSGGVDTGEGVTRLLPVTGSINNFHEYWIAIEPSAGAGTHRVHVFSDGSTTPDTFRVTAGNGNDGPFANYLALGQGATGQSGAVDIDFVAYHPGAVAPAGGQLPQPQQTVYAPPAGGWAYLYAADPGDDLNPGGAALDGTWDHDNGSDQWDGNPIGSGRPGGAQVITEAPDSFLRVQDTGDPRDHGMGDPGSNRKVGFTRDVNSLVPNEYRMLDYGVTLSFRGRLATSAPLDDVHPDGGGSITPWPAGGDGYVIHDGGKGTFGIHQETGDDQTISFALALPSDHAALGGGQGLVMNNLNGTSRSGTVDTGEAGSLNLLPIADPTGFHEFWVTVRGDTSGGGTHRVNVYMDGSPTPTTFHVTAGTGEDEGRNYLNLFQGATPQSGATDVDFVAFRPGVFTPGQGPRPPLVAYYNFDNNTNDQSGNNLNGTAMGDAAYDADVPAQIGSGQSMLLDGSGDYVDLGNPDLLNFDEGNWTVAGWIKTTQSGGSNRGNLYSNGGDGSGGVRTVLGQNEQSDGTLSLTVDDNDDKVQAETDSHTNDGQWHHIVGIRQGRAVAVYVDGELQNSEDLPAAYNLLATAQQPAHIGAGRQQSDGSLIKQLDGQVDDVAVWSVRLPHAVIQGLADGTFNPLTAPLTAPLPDFLPRDAWLEDFINIDIGPDGQRVEPGAVGLPGAPGDGTGNTSYPANPLTAVTGDVITLALDNVDQNGNPVGGIDWRDRGDSDNAGNPLVLLGEDLVKNDLGVIRATLEGVPEGKYLVTAFFVDADNSQSEAIDILLTDAVGTNLLQPAIGDASFPGSDPGEDSLTTNLLEAHSAAFLMVSDGAMPLEIIFNGSLAADDEVPLSGLMIQRVMIPEPSTLLLLLVGGMGLMCWRRMWRS